MRWLFIVLLTGCSFSVDVRPHKSIRDAVKREELQPLLDFIAKKLKEHDEALTKK